jgi:phenylalanyl-tRNA synthetase beta chain
MKVSLNWLREYVDVDADVDELVRKIGAQLGEVEEVVHLGKKYEGALIAKVVERKDHPNADRLSVCKIDVGRSQKTVQVVCGAPNVREGMLVVWLPPGTTVPSTFDKEPFVLEAREVRGETSNGMLASSRELAISDAHEGIMEVEIEAKPGQSFALVYGLDDYVIDIENKMFTHRPDCFGLLGVAREVAGIMGRKFQSPDWYLRANSKLQTPNSKELPLEVRNELPKLAPRFMAVAVSGASVHPSTFYNQTYLSKVGIKPINNIVDLTNYMMYLTGQPMHAYDYDKVAALSAQSKEQGAGSNEKAARMVIRHPQKGEKLKVLGGKVIEPKRDDIMIAAGKELIGFGGVIGGEDTQVDEGTTNIILECANFDLYAVRKTAMEHGLFTDAVTRFSKGQSPLQTDRVLARALQLALEGPAAKQASEVIDSKSIRTPAKDSLIVDPSFINRRLGLKLPGQEIAQLLRNVEFTVKTKGSKLVLKAPFWRTDIEIPEDVVEEVGRLYGYDHLPLQLPSKKMSPSVVDDELRAKAAIRSRLSSLGANEVLSYSFVHGDLFDKTGQDNKQAFQVKNALSPDLQYYRLSLAPSLLEKVHPNLKAGYSEFALFEIGKVHSKSEVDEDGLPREMGRAGLVIAGGKKSKTKPDYFLAKHYLEQLYPRASEITYQKPGGTALDKHKMASQMLAPYEPKRSAVVFVDGKPAGVVGEYRQAVVEALKLPVRTAGFEVFLSSLSKRTSGYRPISKYPRAGQDISLRTDAKLTYAKIKMALEEALEKYSPQDVDVEVHCIDIFQKDKARKQTAFRINASSYERTLTAKVISLMLDKAADELERSIKAERV